VDRDGELGRDWPVRGAREDSVPRCPELSRASSGPRDAVQGVVRGSGASRGLNFPRSGEMKGDGHE
jgi:hypothetical protein